MTKQWRKCTFKSQQDPTPARQEVILRVLNEELPESELTAAEAAFVEERVQRALFRYLKADARARGLAVIDQIQMIS